MTSVSNTPSVRTDNARRSASSAARPMARNPAFAAAARTLGRLLGEAGMDMVFGGGNIGLMGADGASRARSRAAGARRAAGFPAPSRTAHDRGRDGGDSRRICRSASGACCDLADAFVILPGGLGTLDEFFEVVTSAQLGVLRQAHPGPRHRWFLCAAEGAAGTCGRCTDLPSPKPRFVPLRGDAEAGDGGACAKAWPKDADDGTRADGDRPQISGPRL